MTRPLSSKQRQVMQFILAEIDAGRRFPSTRDIADRMGWKTGSSATDVLYILAYRGLVEVVRREPSGRGWKYKWGILDTARDAVGCEVLA